LSSVMRIEDKEKPAYLLGYAYEPGAHEFKFWCALAPTRLLSQIPTDKICTALHLYRCIVCPSISPLSLPLTESSNLETNVHIWSWFFPLLCSHS
jgi:hypothetical protein